MFFTMGFIHKVRVSTGAGCIYANDQEFRDEFERVSSQNANLLGESTKVDNDLVALGRIEFFEYEEFALRQIREGLAFNDLDEEAQKPVGKAEAKDEKMALLQAPRRASASEEVVGQAGRKESAGVVVPDHKIAVTVSATEDLINKAGIGVSQALAEDRGRAIERANACATAFLGLSPGEALSTARGRRGSNVVLMKSWKPSIAASA